MNKYYTYTMRRGLDSVKLIVSNLKSKTWLVPDFICDEVLDVIKEHVADVQFYHVKDDFDLECKLEADPNKEYVIYTVDYFGSEQAELQVSDKTIVVRDSVWFHIPVRGVKSNEIWFNSYRKILHAEGFKGSLIISPIPLYDMGMLQTIYPDEVSSSVIRLMWFHDELKARVKNLQCLTLELSQLAVMRQFQFPSVFPIRLKDRDHVLSQLDFKFPGMWKNKYNLDNKLYSELVLIPLDSRYSPADLTQLASNIKKLHATEPIRDNPSSSG